MRARAKAWVGIAAWIAAWIAALIAGCALQEGVSREDAGRRRVEPPPAQDLGLLGVADLHAHPATHLAFDGRSDGTGGILWGHPGLGLRTPGIIPAAPNCDAETHLTGGIDPVQRFTRALVFQTLGNVAAFPHGPGGDLPEGSRRDYQAWPNARDPFHQLMHVEGLRRAFEGGTRLMFASVTDNRTLAHIFRSPIFPGPIAFEPEEDFESALAQVRFIHEMALANASWMAVVTSPDQAEDVIRGGRLALVISLEMDTLTIEEVEILYRDWGARHIIPIHLADNEVGGTAAFDNTFNVHSGLLSVMLGAEEPRYLAIEPAAELGFRFTWLERLGLGLASFEPAPMRYEQYASLGYEPFPLCEGREEGVAPGYGHRNALGLRDTEYFRRLRELGMIIDVAHMGERSTNETLRLLGSDDRGCGYPVIDSHTGVSPPSATSRGSERDLSFAQARLIVRNGGVIGLGTQGLFGPVDRNTGQLLGATPLFLATGGPLHVFDRGETHRFTLPIEGAIPASLRQTVVSPVDAPRGQILRFNRPEARAGVLPYLEVEPCEAGSAGQIGKAILATDCSAERAAGRPCREMRCGEDERCEVDLSDVLEQDMPPYRALRLGWLSPEVCDGVRRPSSGQAPLRWDLTTVELDGRRLPGAIVARGCTDAGCPRNSSLWFSLNQERTRFSLGRWSCAPPPALPPDPRPQPREVLRIQVRSGGVVLPGESAILRGTNVCARLIGVEPALSALARGGCGDGDDGDEGWFTLNHRAGWGAGVELAQYLVLAPGEEASRLRGIELRVEVDDARWRPWPLGSIRIDRVGDPVLNWADNYLYRMRELRMANGGEEVAFALGTDINGLVSQFPLSGIEPEQGGELPTIFIRDPERGFPRRLPLPPTLLIQRRGSSPLPLLFQERGMASWGMLPDLYAILWRSSQAEGGEDHREVLDALFRSTEATLSAWRRAERCRGGDCPCLH